MMFKEGKPLRIWDLQYNAKSTQVNDVIIYTRKIFTFADVWFGMFQRSLTLIFFMHPWIS